MVTHATHETTPKGEGGRAHCAASKSYVITSIKGG